MFLLMTIVFVFHFNIEKFNKTDLFYNTTTPDGGEV